MMWGFFTGMLVVVGIFLLGIITEALAKSLNRADSKETYLAAGEKPIKNLQ